jgi:hypothetical protein
MSTLTDIVNSKIKRAFKEIEKSKQLQSVIDPELIFRKNSINLNTGRRGSGKTFNILRELIKLSNLKGHGGCGSFICCTDKTNDDAANELLSMVKLKIRIVGHKDALVFLADLVDAKMGCSELLENGLLEDGCVFFFISPLQRPRVTSRLWRFVRNELPVSAKATIGSLNLLKKFFRKVLGNLTELKRIL